MIFDELKYLTNHHIESCDLYQDYLKTLFPEFESAETLSDLPYLPVRAFKDFTLKSVDDQNIYKVMRSSGTTGRPSMIYLDKQTAQLQIRTLINSFADTFGDGRFPMLIIDSQKTVSDRRFFSARTAAINGFSMFSKGRCFALDENMVLDVAAVKEFLAEHAGKQIFIFGFTFLVWKQFVEALKCINTKIDLTNSFLLHGGGWKKLEAEKVSSKTFKQTLEQLTGCRHVHNYYGMIEQTGSIFIECEKGHMHASAVSEVLIRDPETLEPVGEGETGLIQLFSTIQMSYPGQSLLTEDIGRRFDNQICGCGHPGAIIEVDGRLEHADLRGCSDAYP